jgi:hypothetical protein
MSVDQAVSEEGRRILEWLRSRKGDGRPRAFSPGEIARGVYPKMDGPTPGVLFDYQAWPRVNRALDELVDAGLLEIGWLPQGDQGFRLPG